MDILNMASKKQKTGDVNKTKCVMPLHFTSVNQLKITDLNALMNEADKMRGLVKTAGGDDRLKHRILASLFYEPSTRTSCSFQAAMQRLGGSVISVNSQTSSIQKGETIEDTIQTLCCYCDAIVMRHPVKGSLETASKVCSKALINAGDGVGEHPTQALLDLYTIKCELGSIGSIESVEHCDAAHSSMTIAMVGDLKNGRTVHSLVRLLKQYSGAGIRFLYVSPESLSMPAEIVDEVTLTRIEQSVCRSLEEAISQADVLYMTRIQKERFATIEEYEEVSGVYCLDAALMTKAKPRMIVMHPLPRVGEIADEVDADPRAAYIRQMENGLYIRMAILNDMLSNQMDLGARV